MTRHRFGFGKLLLAALVWCAPTWARAQDPGGMGLDLSDEPKKDQPPPEPPKDVPPPEPTPGDTPPPDTGAPAQPAAAPSNNIGERDANLEDRVKSVSKRRSNKTNHLEIEPQAGLTINDPYYTKFGLGGTVDFHFSDSIALGARFDYLVIQESGNVPTAKRELESRLPVSNPDYDAAIDFQWVPIYAKASLFNTIIQFDNMLIGGVGVVRSQTSGSSVSTDPRLNEGFHPMVEVGLGQRYPLNELFAFEWKLMETMYNDIPGGSGPATLERMTMVYMGLAIFIPPIHSSND